MVASHLLGDMLALAQIAETDIVEPVPILCRESPTLILCNTLHYTIGRPYGVSVGGTCRRFYRDAVLTGTDRNADRHGIPVAL